MSMRSLAWVLLMALVVSDPALAARSLQQAVEEVRRNTGGKILSAETVRAGRQQVFRVKVLTRDGRVRVVQVPAEDNKKPQR